MSVVNYIQNKLERGYETLRWELKYSSIPLKLFYPFWWILYRERGTEFPFYFPNEREFLIGMVSYLMEGLDRFVNLQEPERYPGETDLTFIRRMKYVFYNFHYYSNGTMANLYFSKQLPQRDYQRVKHLYNHYALGFMAYNTLSGLFLVALTNYFFRSRKATLPTVFASSLVIYGLFAMNYRASYVIADRMFSNNVRRLGHTKLIHNYGAEYPRNVDYLSL